MIKQVRLQRHIDISQILILLVLFFLSLTFVLPIVITFSISVSTPEGLLEQNSGLLPRGFTLEAYKTILNDPRVLRYYVNTIIYAVLGTIIMLVLTSMLAYPLIDDKFSGKKIITVLLIITMFFSGGLVPYYLLIRNLKMYNTIWAMILPGSISAWNVIVFKTFFIDLPKELREAAYIDGASHFITLFKIIIPLSKPLFATFALFSIVGYWNDYFTALIFLRDENKYPIALLLRKMLVLLDGTDVKGRMMALGLRNVNTRTAKSAAVIVTMLPIIMIYPSLQKYFTKGILVGSIKA